MTDTNYMFDSSNEGFQGALDRFAQFFIAPLLKEDSTEREMEAVDSEYNQALQNDSWRFWGLVTDPLANAGRHLNKFSIGNVDTLKLEGIREVL